MAAECFYLVQGDKQHAAKESPRAQKIALCSINRLPGSRRASPAVNMPGYIRLLVASTTIKQRVIAFVGVEFFVTLSVGVSYLGIFELRKYLYYPDVVNFPF